MIREVLQRAYRVFLPLIYSRVNFKLFLKTTLTELDSHSRRLAAVSDYFSNYIRPIPIRAPFGRSMLVIHIAGCRAATVANPVETPA